LGIARFLIERGAGMIVVACNTASAAGLASLRAALDVPVVGMEPAVKPAAQQTRTGHVGVLATAGTLSGDLFRNTTARHANGVAVHVQVGAGLVERVEAGQANTPETVSLLRTYLQPMLDVGVDQIVLGCTHYSFLAPAIRHIVPEWVSVVDPAGAVARRVEQVLAVKEIEPDRADVGGHCPAATSPFFTSGQPEMLASAIRDLAGLEPKVEGITWDVTGTRVVPLTGAYLYGTIP
jgi:glutamate racemase